MEGCLGIEDVEITMSNWSSGTRVTVYPLGNAFFDGDREEMVEVLTSHSFQCVCRWTASRALPSSWRVESQCSCWHANLRMGEKGHPGASGIDIPFRK